MAAFILVGCTESPKPPVLGARAAIADSIKQKSLQTDGVLKDSLMLQQLQSPLAQQFATFTAPEKPVFCGEAMPDDEDVRERFDRDFYVNVYDRAQITMYLKRSGRFFPYIEQRLKDAGLPDDLKYLMVAESAMRNVSSPAGAAGFWQLMPRVAESYGLTVNANIDERYNLEMATDGAIRYLKTSYKRFGNWTVVAASYNMGMGGAADEMAFQGQQSYYDLWLNDETARYLFRILAIKEVMANAAKYGYGAVSLYKPMPVREVETGEAIENLGKWAKTKGTSFKMLRVLNPWIRGRLLPRPPNGKYKIKLPAAESPKDQRDAAAYGYISTDDELRKLKTGIYTVREGETLQVIAERFGMSVDDLKRDNNLQSEVRAGQMLKVKP